MDVNSRLSQIKDLDLFIKNKQNILNDVLIQLDWKEELIQSEIKVPCPRNPSHWIPESALPQHQEICEWIEEGYAREELEKQPPDSSFFYENSDVTSVPIDCQTVEQVLSENNLLNYDHNKLLNIPKTYERWTVEFNREQRLAIYDHVIKVAKAVEKPKNVTLEDLMIDFEKKEEGEKPKSQLEILAEMRDYKRRRQSYRAKNVHITKKSYTEIMKEVIENQTSYLAETKKADGSDDGKGEFRDSERNGSYHSNYHSDESSSEYRDYQEHRDHTRKHHHSRKRSSSHSPKRKKHKKDRSRSRTPTRHKHKKSHKHKRSHD